MTESPADGVLQHPSTLSEIELLKQCQSRRQRRSGPGGQHRNKVETAVVFTHLPSSIQGRASERRSQGENRKQALFRLRIRLALELRGTRVTPLSSIWSQRVQKKRIQIRPGHEDFPAMLSEVLDHLQQTGGELSQLTELIDCSNSQLIKFLKLEPQALATVNQWRSQSGLNELR